MYYLDGLLLEACCRWGFGSRNGNQNGIYESFYAARFPMRLCLLGYPDDGVLWVRILLSRFLFLTWRGVVWPEPKHYLHIQAFLVLAQNRIIFFGLKYGLWRLGTSITVWSKMNARLGGWVGREGWKVLQRR